MVLEVKIDHLRAEKMKVKHQSVFFLGHPVHSQSQGIHRSQDKSMEKIFLN